MHLIGLAPEIQLHILSMHAAVGRGSVTERRLRSVTLIPDPAAQVRMYCRLVEQEVVLKRRKITKNIYFHTDRTVSGSYGRLKL
jgi:hypothetical protein